MNFNTIIYGSEIDAIKLFENKCNKIIINTINNHKDIFTEEFLIQLKKCLMKQSTILIISDNENYIKIKNKMDDFFSDFSYREIKSCTNNELLVYNFNERNDVNFIYEDCESDLLENLFIKKRVDKSIIKYISKLIKAKDNLIFIDFNEIEVFNKICDKGVDIKFKCICSNSCGYVIAKNFCNKNNILFKSIELIKEH